MVIFCLSIPNSMNESTKYESGIRAFTKMKTFLNDKDSSDFYQQEEASIVGIENNFNGEYCKKLTQKII